MNIYSLISVSFNAKDVFTEIDKCFLINLIRNSSKIYLFILKLIVCHCPQSFLAPLLINVSILLEIKQREYIRYLLFGEYSNLEALFLFKFQSFDDELFNIFRLLKAKVRAEILHEFYDSVLSEILVSLVFERVLLCHQLYLIKYNRCSKY